MSVLVVQKLNNATDLRNYNITTEIRDDNKTTDIQKLENKTAILFNYETKYTRSF